MLHYAETGNRIEAFVGIIGVRNVTMPVGYRTTSYLLVECQVDGRQSSVSIHAQPRQDPRVSFGPASRMWAFGVVAQRMQATAARPIPVLGWIAHGGQIESCDLFKRPAT